MDDVVLKNALAFAAMGHSVLPLFSVVKAKGADAYACTCGDAGCASPGKHPHRLVPHGLKDATADPSVIEAWRAHLGEAELNFGVRTDRLVGARHRRRAGRASLKRLEELHGALPQTWRASTGSGRSLRNGELYSMSGRHIYFKPPRGGMYATAPAGSPRA